MDYFYSKALSRYLGQRLCLSMLVTLALNSFTFAAAIAEANSDSKSLDIGAGAQTTSADSKKHTADHSVNDSQAALADKQDKNDLLRSQVQVNVEEAPSLFNRLPITEESVLIKSNKAKSVGKIATTTTQSLINFVFDARGFDFSMEGADLVLGQHQLKGDSAREYIGRVATDKKELATIQTIMALAASLDQDNTKTEKARADLEKLLGAEAAKKIADEVASLPVVEFPADREKLSWDLDDRRDKGAAILQKSAEKDKVLEKITERLSKYNTRSKAMQIMAKVVYAGCGIASFTPTLAAPISGATMLAFMYATGGPEQDKLLKELYLSKMMQSRCELTNEKAQLVIGSMDLALLTNNKRLYTWSKQLLNSMTDKETADSMFSVDHLAEAARVNQELTK